MHEIHVLNIESHIENKVEIVGEVCCLYKIHAKYGNPP